MPGAAHDGDTCVPVLQRGAQALTHMCFALGLAYRPGLPPAAHGCHRFGHRVERGCTVAAVLDDVLPPSLGIRVSRRGSQRRDRIAHRVIGQQQFAVACTCIAGERYRQR